MYKSGWGVAAVLGLWSGLAAAAPVTVDGAAVRELAGESVGLGAGATTQG